MHKYMQYITKLRYSGMHEVFLQKWIAVYYY